MALENLVKEQSLRQKVMVVLALAVPAMIENILQTVVGFVDTLFVAQLGLTEVTAVGIANAIIAVYIAIFMAIGIGTSSLIAQNIGAGNIAGAKRVAKQSTIISCITGILFGSLTFFFAELLLSIMGAEPNVMKEGVTYLRIVGVPSIFIALMFIFGSILRASGDTKTPMKVSLWINILHVGLDFLLIFGIGSFAGWGVAGAAWATVIVRIIGTGLLFYYVQHSSVSFSWSRQNQGESMMTSILKLSTPAAAERLFMRVGQVLYFSLIVHIGTETYAAHTIAGNIETFSYMPGYGLAIAATTLVGQCIGSKKYQEAYVYGLLTTGIGVLFMSVIGVFMFILAPWLASWFTSEASAIKMVTIALRIDAFAQPALAVGLILTGALQGAGDTKTPMYSTAVGMWVVRIIGIYVLGIKLEMGIAGVWLAIALDIFVRAIFLFWKYHNLFQKFNHSISGKKVSK